MVSKNRPVALGVLSTASINELVLAGVKASDHIKATAVASRDISKAENYARKHEIEQAYGSYEELLYDPKIEAVYISLPNAMHIEWIVRALEAGKHVLCEKPLSRHAEQVERAYEVARDAKRVLMEGFMYRHHPQTRQIKSLVEEGAIGRLRMIRATFSFPQKDPTNVRMQSRLNGGSLMDLGCYCVSGARLLAGEPKHVVGEQLIGPTGVDVAFYSMLRFRDDVVALLDTSFVVPPRQSLEVFGEKGALIARAPWRLDWGGSLELWRDEGVASLDVESVDSYRLEVENFADAVRGKALPALGKEDAIGQARTIEALYRSAKGGHRVSLPAVDVTSAGD